MNDEKALPDVLLFKIDADRCDLHVGDPVAPETIIGDSCTTGETMKAGYQGIVEAVNACNEDHALLVWIRPSRA